MVSRAAFIQDLRRASPEESSDESGDDEDEDLAVEKLVQEDVAMDMAAPSPPPVPTPSFTVYPIHAQPPRGRGSSSIAAFTSRIRVEGRLSPPSTPNPIIEKFESPPPASRTRGRLGKSLAKGKKKAKSPSPSIVPEVEQVPDLKDRIPAVPFDLIDQAAAFAREHEQVNPSQLFELFILILCLFQVLPACSNCIIAKRDTCTFLGWGQTCGQCKTGRRGNCSFKVSRGDRGETADLLALGISGSRVGKSSCLSFIFLSNFLLLELRVAADDFRRAMAVYLSQMASTLLAKENVLLAIRRMCNISGLGFDFDNQAYPPEFTPADFHRVANLVSAASAPSFLEEVSATQELAARFSQPTLEPTFDRFWSGPPPSLTEGRPPSAMDVSQPGSSLQTPGHSVPYLAGLSSVGPASFTSTIRGRRPGPSNLPVLTTPPFTQSSLSPAAFSPLSVPQMAQASSSGSVEGSRFAAPSSLVQRTASSSSGRLSLRSSRSGQSLSSKEEVPKKLQKSRQK